jgi:hypothetical protein
MSLESTSEHRRLHEARNNPRTPWRKWGPYLSERQWGTVREDYSANGDAWNYFTHDQARSRAYRWGEDGLAGISDDKQRLCFALALWNGADPILKERLFGLANSEGNHGEDVKEYYFYLDSTPTHSYMKYLYKYPMGTYPYADLIKTNRARSRDEMEYELLDTGVFDNNKYFDVFVEYAKETPEEILIRVTAHNRSSQPASLHLLPTLWFRNTWSWPPHSARPSLSKSEVSADSSCIVAANEELGTLYFHAEGGVPLLFTENETNKERLWQERNDTAYVKDGINDYLVNGRAEAINPAQTGTKAAAHYQLQIAPGQSQAIRLRISQKSPDGCLLDNAKSPSAFSKSFDEVFALRKQEADEFYDSLTNPEMNEDQRNVMRQAYAGMLWTKQFYYFDLNQWLIDHGASAGAAVDRMGVRNVEWVHMVNDEIISMPDKWEYPWYAAWDLAFHTISLAAVDLDFAKSQLDLMLQEMYMHPNGQIPAYEWNFSDVNPPVHAWATYFIYRNEKELTGKGDLEFLRRSFHKLSLNFSWWVNRKDPSGKNVFEGGFLGLDNIGVFDRSAPLPTGGHLEQADGTAWMAFFSQCMLQIALELAQEDPLYEDMAIKFVEHFLWIAAAIDRIGVHEDEMWDEDDAFFYDLLRLPDGTCKRLKIRSLVGLLPLCAVTVLPADVIARYPRLAEGVRRRLAAQPQLRATIAFSGQPGVEGRLILSLMDEAKLRKVLARMLDESRFFSPYGIRSLSRNHLENPYVFEVHGETFRVDYWPAESKSGLFGGNSNWRGPIWFPTNVLLIRALLLLYTYFGDRFKLECPTGSGHEMNLLEIAQEISARLTRIFLRDEQGSRPVYGGTEIFQSDPHWKDLVLFYEYLHGDNGAGLGASHQTGWTGLVARLFEIAYIDAERLLKHGAQVRMQAVDSRATTA